MTQSYSCATASIPSESSENRAYPHPRSTPATLGPQQYIDMEKEETEIGHARVYPGDHMGARADLHCRHFGDEGGTEH